MKRYYTTDANRLPSLYYTIPDAKRLPSLFSAIEQKGWIKQTSGSYRGFNEPCCVGARLAQSFYVNGKNALAQSLRNYGFVGCNPVHIILMFRACGLRSNPWTGPCWNILPSIVFKRLLKIEKLPSTINANLNEVDLRGADLRGADLRGADLRGCSVRDAKLRGADLRGANLAGADFHVSDLTKADMRGADLLKTNLSCADLLGAKLEGAKNLENAYLLATRLTFKQEKLFGR